MEASCSSASRSSVPWSVCARSGWTTTETVMRACPRWRASDTSGSTSERGRQRAPLGRPAAVVGEGEAAHEHGAGGGRAGEVARGVVHERAPAEVARADARPRGSGPPRATRAPGREPSPASTKPSRSGCSKQKKRSSARRARRTAADRSSAGRHRHGDRRERGRRLPPRGRHGPLDPLGEPLARGRAQLERAERPGCRERHGRSARWCRARATRRPRRCGPSRSGRTAAPAPRTRRSCRRSR